ncbi:hypothetical protein F8M41_010037 [Gigaspora margarita]|uniref:Uncharacterized protein n=1 Tax=Gigaspora margarita TaxID=4874 RepID=A0A8H4AUN6_GIGMA|nr:hypothetical protein F8M41_010037 [Gigaspora margarita]
MISSTYSGPFLKENDISRQADKPIYTEDQVNDSQTQHTEQALVSCAAVRTELTLSNFTEVQPFTLATNASYPAKVKSKQILLISNTTPTQDTCYNRFLQYYKLPTLLLSQTIETFLKYIQNNYPELYTPQFIKISIYTNEPCSLPNHSLLPFEDILYCYKILLKSTTSSHSTSSSTLELSQLYTSSHIQQNLHLIIATHNVRGFNVASKRQIWQDYCINNNISIAYITETKISYKTKLSFCNNNLFTYYWANSDSS